MGDAPVPPRARAAGRRLTSVEEHECRISNAAKFTENGTITLTVSRTISDDEEEWISEGEALEETGVGENGLGGEG